MTIFTTVTMTRSLKLMPPAHTWLKNRYFSNIETFDTDQIAIDIEIGLRKMAPFVAPEIGGKVINREGYRTDTFEAPELSPELVTTADQLMNRFAGEAIGGSLSPMERAAIQLGKDLVTLDEMISRREEWMAAQALFKGGITIKGDGVDQRLQYWPQDTSEQPYQELTGGAEWSASGSDPRADLRDARREIIQRSGVTPRDVIMGSAAIDAFLERIKEDKFNFDYRKVDTGQIDPSHLPNGVTYWGYLKDVALDVYSYDDYYLDDQDLDENGNPKEKAYVPEDLVWIGSPDMRTTMAYGLVSVFRASQQDIEMYAQPRVPSSYIQAKNPAGRVVQIKSRPLPIVHQVLASKVLKVV